MSESTGKPQDRKPHESSVRVTKGRLAGDVAVYSIARLLLVVVIAAVILGVAALVGVTIPLLVVAIFAVLIALPLSLLLFRSLRNRVNEGIAAFDSQRRADRAELRAKLRGEGPS